MTPLPALFSSQSRVARVPVYIYARYLHHASATRRKDLRKDDMGLEILHLGGGGGSRSRSSSGPHDDKKPVSQHIYREELDDDADSAVDVRVSPAVTGCPAPDVKEYLVLTCVLAAAMMDGYNATVAIPLIPTLSTLLTTPLDNALWLSTSYLLVNASIQPLCALLFRTSIPTPSGIPLLTALTTSTVGTGICAGSSNLPTLITGRIIQGLGSGAATALSLHLVERAISPPHRARFAGYVLRARGAGAVVGAVMGGLLGERRNWAAGFYFGLLFCAVALLVGPFGVELARASPSSSSPSSTAAAAADDDDDDVGDIALGDGESGACCGEGGGVGEDKRQWNGKHTLRRRSKLGLAVLGAIGAGLLLLGVSGGGTRAQWAEWSVVLPFCLGGVLVGMVGLAGAYCVVVLVCVRRVSVRTVMLYIGGLLHGVMLSTHIHLLSLYLSLIRTLTPTQTGLSLAALTISLTLPFCVNASEKRTHFALWAVRLGWALNVLLTGCFALLDEETPTAGWVFALLGAGLSHAVLARGMHLLLLSSSSSFSSSSSSSSSSPSPSTASCSSDNTTSAAGVRAIATHSLLFTWGTCVTLPVCYAILIRLVWAGGWDGEVDVEGPEGVISVLGMMFRSREGEVLLQHVVEGLGDLWKLWMGVGGLGVVSSLFVR